jgi:hypothetical protein
VQQAATKKQLKQPAVCLSSFLPWMPNATGQFRCLSGPAAPSVSFAPTAHTSPTTQALASTTSSPPHWCLLLTDVHYRRQPPMVSYSLLRPPRRSPHPTSILVGHFLSPIITSLPGIGPRCSRAPCPGHLPCFTCWPMIRGWCPIFREVEVG